MNVVFAGNHDEYEAWLRDNFCYCGDAKALAAIDPDTVGDLICLSGFMDHPLYLSDEVFEFQVAVSRAKFERKSDGSNESC